MSKDGNKLTGQNKIAAVVSLSTLLRWERLGLIKRKYDAHGQRVALKSEIARVLKLIEEGDDERLTRFAPTGLPGRPSTAAKVAAFAAAYPRRAAVARLVDPRQAKLDLTNPPPAGPFGLAQKLEGGRA